MAARAPRRRRAAGSRLTENGQMLLPPHRPQRSASNLPRRAVRARLTRTHAREALRLATRAQCRRLPRSE
eukprot:1922510-Pleurochrysis_carterae.AAC.2